MLVGLFWVGLVVLVDVLFDVLVVFGSLGVILVVLDDDGLLCELFLLYLVCGCFLFSLVLVVWLCVDGIVVW